MESAEAQSELSLAQWPINQGGNLIKTYNVNTSIELSPLNVEVRGSSEGWHPGPWHWSLTLNLQLLCICGDGVMGCPAQLHYQYWLCATQSVEREEQHSVNRVRLVTSFG